MRVMICTRKDKDAGFYIQFAERQGQKVTEVDGCYFVNVLTDGPVWRAEGVVFQNRPVVSAQIKTH